MHEKPLSELTGYLVRRYRSASEEGRHGEGPDRFGLEESKVLAFVDGTLDPAQEARLAQEVAEVLPLGWSLPFRAKERLNRVAGHLGGERELLEWLDRHPGLPRLTARLLALASNLEHFSDDPAVIETLRSSGAGAALPAELKEVLPPALSEETLSDLSHHVDQLLFDRHVQEAKQFALTTTEWLRTAAEQSATAPPEVAEMRDVMGHLHQDISEAQPV